MPSYKNIYRPKKTDLIWKGEQQLKITIEIFWVFSSTGDINIDGSCVNMSRLRLFSIDDNPYINEQAKVLKESLLNELKKPSIKVENSNTDVDKLVNKIEASGISIAPNYEDYLKLAIVFYNELGEGGRNYFHRVCCLDSKYNSKDYDNLYDDISKRNYTDCTLGTLIFLMQQSNVIWDITNRCQVILRKITAGTDRLRVTPNDHSEP